MGNIYLDQFVHQGSDAEDDEEENKDETGSPRQSPRLREWNDMGVVVVLAADVEDQGDGGNAKRQPIDVEELGLPPNPKRIKADVKIEPLLLALPSTVPQLDSSNDKIHIEVDASNFRAVRFDILDPDDPEGKHVKMTSKNFIQEWNRIACYRMERPDAPVDLYGCDVHRGEQTELERRWSVMVSCVISSQTRDLDNAAAMKRLSEHLSPKTINGHSLANLSAAELEKLLYPISFYRNKAKYLKSIADRCIEDYAADIPDTLKEVLALPGVGPKMAHLIMKGANGEVSGIAVDVHVHRIANRLGWVSPPAKTPDHAMKHLQSTLDPILWAQINHMLVGFGQHLCVARNPKCHECPVSDTCPSANIKCITAKPRKGRKTSE